LIKPEHSPVPVFDTTYLHVALRLGIFLRKTDTPFIDGYVVADVSRCSLDFSGCSLNFLR